MGSSTDGWTGAAAQVELQNVLADVRRGIWVAPTPVVLPDPGRHWTFHEWATKFLNDRRSRLSTRGVESWEWALTNHLLPHFKDFLLVDISKLAIHEYKVAKIGDREHKRVERPLSNGSINRTVARLSELLEEAAEFDLIPTNPPKVRASAAGWPWSRRNAGGFKWSTSCP